MKAGFFRQPRCFVACARVDYRGKMAAGVETDAKVTNQMRLSNPLLLLSLGVVLAAASCTLITDVDRSKIPDGSSQAGAPGTDGGSQNGGTSSTPQAGEAGVSGGGTNAGGGGSGSDLGGAGGNPEAGAGGTPEGGSAGAGGTSTGGAGAGAGGEGVGAAGAGG
jgi:hypothetical protein